MKTFNTAGTCRPNEHYMVDITERLEIIRGMVAKGDYFCINRGRQYGKTTTLEALATSLASEYTVFKLSFEGASQDSFASIAITYAYFLKTLLFNARLGLTALDDAAFQILEKAADGQDSISDLDFAYTIPMLCKANGKPIVILIDEVDQAGNYESFLQFLGVLRKMFLNRASLPTFQSVILAGVYDIKNLKLKIRKEDEHQYNSPWNIAVPFDVDMSLSAEGISEMLAEYKADHNLTFDEVFVAQMIRDYTAGYPFLVSRICQIIDAQQYSWDKEGVLKATHDLLVERNTLFDDMVKILDQYPKLKELLRNILFEGKTRTFHTDEKYLQIGLMFNFLANNNGTVAIACRLMETRLYNLFIGENETSRIFSLGQMDKNQFVHDGFIDMRLLMERFCVHFNEIYRPGHDDQFVEDNGRKIFLTYLRPIINGIGNYYCEAQTRDLTRTDIIIDYLGQQYIIELKIWRGKSYNERGEKQLAEYLERYNLQTGYMVSFCFNKNKQSGLQPPVELNCRTLIEAIV